MTGGYRYRLRGLLRPVHEYITASREEAKGQEKNRRNKFAVFHLPFPY
jgi:hypothetical protein